jgi:hypothetical protein
VHTGDCTNLHRAENRRSRGHEAGSPGSQRKFFCPWRTKSSAVRDHEAVDRARSARPCRSERAHAKRADSAHVLPRVPRSRSVALAPCRGLCRGNARAGTPRACRSASCCSRLRRSPSLTCSSDWGAARDFFIRDPRGDRRDLLCWLRCRLVVAWAARSRACRAAPQS